MIEVRHPGVVHVTDVDEAVFPPASFLLRLRTGLSGTIRSRRQSLTRAEAIVVSHNYLREQLLAHYPVEPTRVHVIGHGPPADPWPAVDEVSRRITREVYGGERSYFFVPAAGKPSDNLVVAIRAYELFRDRLDEPTRLVVQHAAHGRAVRRAAAKSRYRADITLLPSTTEAETRKLFAAARAVVHPSLSTRFPEVVLRAWAAGVPVVYWDGNVIGMAGARVRSTDARGYAEALVELVATPFLASGLVERGRARLAEMRWAGVEERLRAVEEGLGEG